MQGQIDYTFIDEEQALHNLVTVIKSLTADDYIAIDTEFIRVRTYYPVFALLQLKCRDRIYIVDPKALCIKQLLEAINNTKAYILMFSCDEDLEILYQASADFNLEKCLPERIYDVQLLCAFESTYYKPGLFKLINEVLNIDTAGDCSLTNWELRPLSDSQLCYAACDVAYLYELFTILKERVGARKFAWFESEMAHVISDNTQKIEPDMLYRAIAGAGALSKDSLLRLQYLCKKRYEIAIEHNIALNQLITSKALCTIAQSLPRNNKDLLKAGVKYGCLKEHGAVILKLVDEAMSLKTKADLIPPFDSFMHNGAHKVYIKRLKDYLKTVAVKEGIAGELLYSKRYIQDFFLPRNDGQAMLESSWRALCCKKLDGFKFKS
ncbi:Ribonuclease D [Anaerobiospirillum thomasii]|uniref:ribonuclease D n=1 Tax=Anaerobiospirillum thomasii TaxID=179995 RepID=UPI000D87936B|nr:HRDC domain-containing protein [Anaerobiospirillum thomasii]SPT67761.1 Ribonuclease D [Anaerobiospirillum thomasii]